MYSPPWPHLPLKRLFHIIGGSTPSSNVDAYWDGDVPWYTPADFPGNGSATLPPSSRRISEEGLANSSATVQPAGSLLLATRAPIGPVGILPENAAFNQGCKCLKAKIPLNERYFYYCLSTQGAALNALGRGSTFMELSAESLGAFKVPVPSREAQDQVVRFLDRETAEIDALIEKQERLIALLEEKRQAFISHAVTKGLDPTVPMKDSGIPWVGLIPAHWELQKLRTLVTIEKRIAGTLGYDVFSITQRGLKVKDLDSADGQHSMDYSKYQIVEPGDFAMNHMDLLTGYVDIAQRQGVTSPDYRVFRLKSSSSVLARFLLLVLQDAYRRRVLYAFGQGSSNLGRWRLPSEAFYGFPVALPSQSEQLEIVSEVARFEDDTEKLVSACRKAAHVLRERRASLISAAVTGKIDVTGRV